VKGDTQLCGKGTRWQSEWAAPQRQAVSWVTNSPYKMFTLPGGWNEPVVLSEFPLLSISEKSVIETLNHIFLHCSWLFCIFLRWNSACIFRCWKDSTQQSWGQVLKKSQHIKVGGGEWGEPSFQGRKCFPKSDSKTELSGFLGFSQFSLKAFFHLTATIFSAFPDCPESGLSRLF
jgi:hypothetical protein